MQGMHVWPGPMSGVQAGGTDDFFGARTPKIAKKSSTPGSKALGAGYGSDAFVTAGLIGNVRNEVMTNYRDNALPGIRQPLGQTLENELELFSNSLPSDFAQLSDEAKYAILIQNIQARFKYGGFTYSRDQDTEWISDYWATPAEVIDDRGLGIDCEDFAFMAREYGEAMRQAHGLGGEFQVHGGFVDGRGGRGHAICVYHAEDGNQYVIDGTFFQANTGDFSRIQTLGHYTQEHNFEWIEDEQGNLTVLQTSGLADGGRILSDGTFSADYETTVSPAAVQEIESRGVNRQFAVDTVESVEGEPGFVRGFLDFFSRDREALGDLSVGEVGGAALGPLMIASDVCALQAAREERKNDKEINKQFQNHEMKMAIGDVAYHATKKKVAKAKTAVDVIRYGGAIGALISSASIIAPVIALGATSLRFLVGFYESVKHRRKQASRNYYRSERLEKINQSIGSCSVLAQKRLQIRIDYKLKKSNFGSKRLFGALKGLCYGAAAIMSGFLGVKAIAAGTLLALYPYVFGPALICFGALALLRLGESLYNGYLLKKQNRGLQRAGQSFCARRIERIGDSQRGRLARVGTALNLSGWMTDFVDDRTQNAPGLVKGLCSFLLLPIYGMSLLFQSKQYREEELFLWFKEDFANPKTSQSKRIALLDTLETYYNMSQTDIVFKWMSPSELDELKKYVVSGKKPASRLVRDLLKIWEATHGQRFDIDDFVALESFKRDLLDKITPNFGRNFHRLKSNRVVPA